MESLQQYSLSSNYFNQFGDIMNYARIEKKMGEIYEFMGMLKEAIIHYDKCGKIYKSHFLHGNYYECYLKIGKMYSVIGDYKNSVIIFDDLLSELYNINVSKYSTKNILLYCGIVRVLSQKVDEIRDQLIKYRKLYPELFHTKEYKFIMDITDCVELNRYDEFLDHLYNYSNVDKLDSWTLKMLLKIEELIKNIL